MNDKDIAKIIKEVFEQHGVPLTKNVLHNEVQFANKLQVPLEIMRPYVRTQATSAMCRVRQAALR